MIACRLYGGLGNNLFQLANTVGLAKKHNVEYRVLPPGHGFRPNTAEIIKQSINLEFKDLFEEEPKYVFDTTGWSGYNHHDEDLHWSTFEYKEVPFTDNTVYSGYFQSYRYFDNVTIQEELPLSSKKKLELLEQNPLLTEKTTISLHFRLSGDRPHLQQYHKDVDVEYYRQALEVVTEGLTDYEILLFSDNLPLAQERLKDLPYTFSPVPYSNNVYEFILMSMCTHNILGNSTFSWWSAFYNLNLNKKVVAPASQWYGPGYKHFNLEYTFPPSWIRL